MVEVVDIDEWLKRAENRCRPRPKKSGLASRSQLSGGAIGRSLFRGTDQYIPHVVITCLMLKRNGVDCGSREVWP